MELDGKAGFADGIRADNDGNIWASAGWVGEGYDGVHIFAPDGERIGQILLPEICSNVCFGGAKRNRLFMTASQSLYAVYVETQGRTSRNTVTSAGANAGPFFRRSTVIIMAPEAESQTYTQRLLKAKRQAQR